MRLAHLAAALESAGTARVIELDVPRENLYASWNRGNVDDARYAGALIDGITHTSVED